MKGLLRVICSGLVGYSPAPHGPHCSSEGSGTREKGGTLTLSCSTRLQSDSPELGPVPDAPISVGMEKAAPDAPSGLQQQQSVTHPALPVPLEMFNASRTGTQGTWGHWGCSGISSALGAGCWQLEYQFPRHSALRGFPTSAAVKIHHSLQAGLTALTRSRDGVWEGVWRSFGGGLEEWDLLAALPLPQELQPGRELGGSTNIPTLQAWSLELLSHGEQGMKILRHC